VFLATTALSQFWDVTAEKIFFLGQWCLRYDRRQEWQHLNYEILPYPWDDREAMHRAAAYEESIYESLLSTLCDFMNEAHGESHSQRYWRILLGPWLLHHVQVLHERFLCLRQAFARYPGLRTIGLAPASYRTPRDVNDYILGCIDDPYNLQLYSSLLALEGRTDALLDLSWGWPRARRTPAAWSLEGLKRQAASLKEMMSCRWSRDKDFLLVDMYISKRKAAALVKASGFRAGLANLPEALSWVKGTSRDKRHPAREELASLPVKPDDDFTASLAGTLPHHLPSIYLEGYEACRQGMKKDWGTARAKVMVTANALELNEAFKFLAADRVERGVKLVAVQHGGSYGSALYNPNERLERAAADEFWSWGWQEEDARVRIMPSAKLDGAGTPVKKRKGAAASYLYYIGNIIPRFHYRTWSCPTAGQTLRYLEWQFSFLRSLRSELLASLLYRPYLHDFGWRVKERIRAACPDLRIDDPPGDYERMIRRSLLVICDMNQTTLLECLAADKPVVAFWEPALWELRAAAAPYYRMLQEVRILHRSPEEAASHLNGIGRDIDAWWKADEIRDARKAFVERFARHSRDWTSVWARRFREITMN